MKKLFLVLFLLFIAGCTPSSISFNSSIPVNVTDGLNISNIDVSLSNQVIDTRLLSYAIALGEIPNSTTWNKWGYNDDIDTATDPEIIASWGGDESFILSSPEYLNISSTDSDDTNGGNGASAVVIWGVNGSWDHVQEIVFLDGTNVVQTTQTYYGVNRVATYLVGGDGFNQGDINVMSSLSNEQQAQIPQGEGSTQQAFIWVGEDKQFLTDSLYLNVNKISGGTPRVTIKAFVKSYVSNSVYEVFRTTIETNAENTISFNPNQPFVVGEKSILYWTAETDTNNAVVNIRFSGFITDS